MKEIMWLYSKAQHLQHAQKSTFVTKVDTEEDDNSDKAIQLKRRSNKSEVIMQLKIQIKNIRHTLKR